MSHHLTFKKNEYTYSVVAPNGKMVGSLQALDDGFLYFFPDGLSGGAWTAWWMREVADKLDELNKPWRERIEKELGS